MKFDYGKDGLEINLDPSWNTTIFKPKPQEVIENPVEFIRETIRNPLKEVLEIERWSNQDEPYNERIGQICIVVSDATRPVPSSIILEAIIQELNKQKVSDDKILVLIATGYHRKSREDELERILGKTLIKRIKAIDHVATDRDSLVDIGITSDNCPSLINKRFYESDIRIITGYVEPHFFYGFSGGRKSIVPGIAGAETIQWNHSAEFIADPNCRFGIYKDNPMHKNGTEIAKKLSLDLVVNVCINEEHKITQVAVGDLEEAHEKLVNYQLKHAFQEIDEPYDIVVCGNGGYPLDLNLYQAVKSMAIGEMGVKEGGTIISVNECADGVGVGQEKFKELIFSGMSPKEIYDKILNKEIIVPDQWEIQILARVLMKAEVYIISTLNENEIGNIGLKYAPSVEEAIKLALVKHGKDAKILLLPNGPQLLPLL